MILKTDRIILRPFKKEDAKDFFEMSSDPQVTEFLTWGPHKEIVEAEDSIKNRFLDNDNVFCIENASEKKCIGIIDFRLTPEHKKAGFGYMLNRNYWGKGYMSEVLKEILTYIFKTQDVNKVESSHYKGNPSSGKVMEKCGMKHEGTQVDSLIIKGKTVTVENYGITRSQFENL